MFDYQSILCDNEQINESFCKSLRTNGYATVHINRKKDIIFFSNDEFHALDKWEEIYRNKFETLTDREIKTYGKYRAEGGVALGYRKDDGREFFETHLKERNNKNNTIDIEVIPQLHKPCLYSNNKIRCKKYPNELCAGITSIKLVQLLRRVGYHTLVQVARSFPELNHLPSSSSSMGGGGDNINNTTCNHAITNSITAVTGTTGTGLHPGDTYFVDMTDCTASGLLEDRDSNTDNTTDTNTDTAVSTTTNNLPSPSTLSGLSRLEDDSEEEEEKEYVYSSSVLRVCHYPEESKIGGVSTVGSGGSGDSGSGDSDEKVATLPIPIPPAPLATLQGIDRNPINTLNLNPPTPPPKPPIKSYGFGAHTDTSFITLGLCNSLQPGLEMLNRESNKWTSVELELALALQKQRQSGTNTSSTDGHGSTNTNSGTNGTNCTNGEDYYCTIFIGEFLQILTNHSYKAVVHRVLAPTSRPTETLDTLSKTLEVGQMYPTIPNCRISCPLIVRGRNKVVINSNKYKYNKYTSISNTDNTDITDTKPKSVVATVTTVVNENTNPTTPTDTDTEPNTPPQSSSPPPLLVLSPPQSSSPPPLVLSPPQSSSPPPLVLSSLYNGLNMKVIHMLLDKKRAKCMHNHHNKSTKPSSSNTSSNTDSNSNDNGNNSDSTDVDDIDWILSAFPEMHSQPK